MLVIDVPPQEMYDESANRFLYLGGATLTLEHSLVSLSKWESKWEKPFLTGKDHTEEELLDYIKCMVTSPVNSPDAFDRLTEAEINRINAYIGSRQSATWFSDEKLKSPNANKEVVTAEVIYYWMIAHTIPMECQYWHLSRLMTLVKVCNAKNSSAQTTNKAAPITRDALAQRKALNEQRKAANNSTG